MFSPSKNSCWQELSSSLWYGFQKMVQGFRSRSGKSKLTGLYPVCMVVVTILSLGGRGRAVDVQNDWVGPTGSNWSTTGTANWSLGVPADDTNLTDSNNVAMHTVGFPSMRTLTLDGNRAIAKLWYNTDGAGDGGGSSNGGLTIAAGGGTLTLAANGATPQIAAGRINTTTGSVTINAPIAGTQGFSVSQQANPYTGGGLILGGANTISGTVAGYRLLTLNNVQALQNATLSFAPAAIVRLRSDTNGTTFQTGGLTQTNNGTTVTVDVDRSSAGTGCILKLGGNYLRTVGNSTATVNVTGSNGYSLEMTGNFTNSSAGSLIINANTVNTTMSGSSVAVGAGVQFGGTLATGTNTVSGVISGTGGLVKSGSSSWDLRGENTYAGATVIQGGTLLVNGWTIGQGSYSFNSLTADTTLGGAGTINLSSNSSLNISGVSGTAQAVVKSTALLDPLVVNTSGTGKTIFGNYSVLDIALAGDVCSLLRVSDLDLSSTTDKIRITASGTQTRNRFVFCAYSGALTGTFNLTQFTGLPGSAWIDYNVPGEIAVVRNAGPSPAAFPGAQGFGATSVGGRGGVVYEVTNLNDSGAGSLRTAVSGTGARTVVFRVSGNIVLASDLIISSPKITIAGQTSPGGICLAGGHCIGVKNDDVIVRGLRCRTGGTNAYPYPPGTDPDNRDSGDFGTTSRTAQRVIFDHCDFSWAIDGNFDIWYATDNSTFQNCIFSEPLWYAGHTGGQHGFNFLIGYSAHHISVHHNLFMHANDRSPAYEEDCTSNFINNVVYNWGWAANDIFKQDATKTAPHLIDFVGNLYIPGLDTGTNRGIKFRNADQQPTTTSRFFVHGNIGPGRSYSSQPEWDAVTGDYDANWHATNLVAGLQGVTLHKADDDLLDYVLINAGANVPRDSVDARLVQQVTDGTGHYINSESEVGGWPALTGPAAPTDTDHDGMPDAWEIAHSLNPNDASDRNGDPDGDGYTNLEEYLNSLFTNYP